MVGGGVACFVEGDGAASYIPLPVSASIRIACVSPDMRVSTADARAVLPASVSMADAVANVQNTAALVASLARPDPSTFASALADRLHQPFRAALVPGLPAVLALNRKGGTGGGQPSGSGSGNEESDPVGSNRDHAFPNLLGVCLSGSGPTVLVMAIDDAVAIGRRVQAIFEEHGLTSRLRVPGVDHGGAFVVRPHAATLEAA